MKDYKGRPVFRSFVINVFEDELINATATATSSAYELTFSGVHGVWYKATSVGGTPDIKIEALQAMDGSDDFVESEDPAAGDIVTNLTDETAHIKSVQLTPSKYVKIKLTGNASNPADTLVTVKLFVQGG